MYVRTERAGDGPRLGQAVVMPRVTAIRFRNTGTTDAANCCAICPAALGVGAGGMARNRMELRFTLAGHQPGFQYEITRTRRDSLWQRVGGVWAAVGTSPMGTNDDHHNDDECNRPQGTFIFVIDAPGMPLALPAPAQSFNATAIYGPGAVTSAAAQDVVLRASFAEWPMARNQAAGVDWTPLELPPLRDGSVRRHVYWHCIVWIHRNGAGNFELDAARSTIRLGSLSAAVINAAPT